MQSLNVTLRPHLAAPRAALICAALCLCGFAGCAPQRMAITDADDLAQFAAASKLAANKKVVVAAKAAEAKTAMAEPAAKTTLDAASQAYLTRITKEQNLDAETLAQFEELLANMTPEMRAVFITTQEITANKNNPAAVPAAPRELPANVQAEPITRRKQEIAQADHQEPARESASDDSSQGNSMRFANEELIAEMRAVSEELAEFRRQQRELEASEALREEAKADEDRRKLMLEALRGKGAMNGMASDDDVGSAMGGLGGNYLHAQIAAAMAKNNASRSDKKAPAPGEGLSGSELIKHVGKPAAKDAVTDTVKDAAKNVQRSSGSPSDMLGGANLDRFWAEHYRESSNDNSLSLEMRKKLFHLAFGDSNAASAPPEGLTLAEKNYWKHLMRVLELSMKLGDHPRRDRQAALVGREMRDAAAELESASVLDLQNAAFCSSVQAFGNYVEFENSTFAPNDEVILYVELQNFASKQRDDGKAYETHLAASYQVLDASGKRAADLDLPEERGLCRQRRRDYFLAYRMHLPKNISEGEYTLQLTMEDKISGKFGQTTLKFAIRK
jgi:hypothetical protein